MSFTTFIIGWLGSWQTQPRWEHNFNEMTKLQARFVRRLRCQHGYTWQSVAAQCDKRWKGDWGSNQFAGSLICEIAALWFDESPYTGSWN